MSKVLITQQFSHNVGDNAALIGAVEALKKLLPDLEFTVLSSAPEDNPLKGEARVLRWLVDRRKPDQLRARKRSRYLLIDTWLSWLRMLWWFLIDFLGTIVVSLGWAVLKRAGIDFRFLVGAEMREILGGYAEADMVLRSPGASFNDNYKYGLWLVVDSLHIYLAKLLGKPTMLFGPSVGPVGRLPYKILTKYVLNKLDLIAVRDRNSVEELARLGVTRPPIHVTADPAFLLKSVSRGRIEQIMQKEGLTGKHPLVGMAPSDWAYPGLPDAKARNRHYIQVMAQAADFSIKEWNATVVFVSTMRFEEFCKEDISVIGEIIDEMQFKEGVKVLPGGYDPKELQGILGEMDLVIATRMHGYLLASNMKVPGVVIMYEPKAKGFTELLGLQSYLLDINTLEHRQVIQKMTDAWSQRDAIRAQLEAKRSEIEKRSFRNAELAVEFLKLSKRQSI